MSQPNPTEPEPVTVVIPITVPNESVGAELRRWSAGLEKLKVPYELLIVDDGSPIAFAEQLESTVPKLPNAKLLRHDSRRGFGACVRTALAESKHPLFFYTALDYPYTPADLGPMLQRIGHIDEYFQRKLDVVSGCRTGRPMPGFWRITGQIVRGFSRIALGLPLEPLPGWLGVREHLRSWIVWFVFGDPLVDPNSAFKLFRKSLFEKFPIQSDGEFVHVELIAKSTFVTALMDELPLTPRPEATPPTRWNEFGKLLRNAKFTAPKPPSPAPSETEPSPPETPVPPVAETTP